MEKHIVIAFSNADPAEETAFNEWYTKHHVVDMLGVEGIEFATRYRRDDEPSAFPVAPQHRYLAIYEIPEEKVDEARRELDAALQVSFEADAAGTERPWRRGVGITEMAAAWYTAIDPTRSS